MTSAMSSTVSVSKMIDHVVHLVVFTAFRTRTYSITNITSIQAARVGWFDGVHDDMVL